MHLYLPCFETCKTGSLMPQWGQHTPLTSTSRDIRPDKPIATTVPPNSAPPNFYSVVHHGACTLCTLHANISKLQAGNVSIL
ncbi:hypothetical protein CEXT_531421 [Caerostris extrusa]|uniref:Uncharacterized protein n=1 Tax=Caerostris extrusa TaxID=172846 RepID=A0AAV4WXV2_CAEEX|nr:hypothetical protein CEXT_531421 [Caerostris extrusa]